MGTPAKKWEICIQSLFVRFNRLTIMSIIITTNDKVPTLKKKVIQQKKAANSVKFATFGVYQPFYPLV